LVYLLRDLFFCYAALVRGKPNHRILTKREKKLSKLPSGVSEDPKLNPNIHGTAAAWRTLKN
jgi:hypothetical protein